jgi:alanyl-tRNA synthetase
LEDVGKDSYHHTFFEMLGSWSFGEYFKEEAIDMAWELLVDEYGLDPERLYATYYEGDDNLPADTDAQKIWSKHLPPSRILACPAKDNFWEMGDTGPCGPCTEIHYDRIGNRDASALVNADDPNVIEIWNVVFIQFDRSADGSLVSLPQKHVDTGMGLERLVSILQGVNSNYDIDTFGVILEAIEGYVGEGIGGYQGRFGDDDPDLVDTAYRAVSDHIRTLCFAIADGAVVSNEGRGYVLRRILRRAERYGQQILKAEKGFMTKLVPVVVDTFSETYPELRKNQELITSTILAEEESFSAMLERGIKHFSSLESDLKSQSKKTLPGKEAFFLYDTLGFPFDLTQLMALEAGLEVDVKSFEEEMDGQKKRSRDAQKKAKLGATGVALELGTEDTGLLEKRGVPLTIDDDKYSQENVEAQVLAVFEDEGVVGVVLDKTSFYAEAGGQECDTGALVLSVDGDEDVKLEISDVQTYGGYILHVGTLVSSDDSIQIAEGDKVTCQVDYSRRKKIIPNHTMTHVLNAALKHYLGDGVEQKGSLNNEEKLRFDFSHDKALTPKQLLNVEKYVNQVIEDECDVTDVLMPLDEAKQLPGVAAVFGEVYPDPVRVVSVGGDTSVEFCGGTHVKNTREAEAFVILEEGAVAKGIRRITAVTRDLAKEAIEEGNKFESQLSEVESQSSNPDLLPTLDKTAGSLRKELDALPISAPLKSKFRARLETLQRDSVKAQKALLAQRVDITLNKVSEQIDDIPADGVKTLVMTLDIGADSKASQKVMNLCKQKNVAFLGMSSDDESEEGKTLVFAFVPDDMQNELKADEWVKTALDCVGGRGGGRVGNAQGQAPPGADIGAVEAAAREYLNARVGVEAV